MAVNDFPKIGIVTQDLIDAVNADIKKAMRLRNKEDFGAVNWGDIGIHDIEYRLSILHGATKPYCVVTVEEADSGCKLAQWLNERLDKQKFPNTYIECDW